MRKIILYPFFSQQDKHSRRFKLGSDSGVRHYLYIAEQAMKLGWAVEFVLPQLTQVHKLDITLPCPTILAPKLEADNLDRRLQWDPTWLRSLQADIVLTQHEHIAIPLRALQPNLKIVMECGLLPETVYNTADLFPLAWRAADFVHCTNMSCMTRVWRYTHRCDVWEFGYDERERRRPMQRDIDVLFNARSSATNYSKHLEFMETFADEELWVRMTDPTGYLTKAGLAKYVHLAPSREQYIELLERSKVVVSLLPLGSSAYSFREAIHHGCVPVCLRHRDNLELLGPDWPYYTEMHNIRDTVRRALNARAPSITCSYENAWKKAKEVLCSLP